MIVNNQPVTDKHRRPCKPDTESQSSLYMLAESLVQISESINTCRVRSAITSGIAAKTRYAGPYFCQCAPLLLTDFQVTYCAKFVIIVKVNPHVIVCEKAFAPAVADIPMKPASRSGQHQLPTKAGMDIRTVNTEATTPLTSLSAF